MKKYFVLLISIFIWASSFSQNKEFNSQEIPINKYIEGTLLLPNKVKPMPLVIIIAGSGPTDRNGNQGMMQNNSLKFLAEGLYDKKIASFRYDKRIFKLAKEQQLVEEEINFNDFITDAASVINFFKNDPRFSKIVVLGHSQGSLVGMIASQKNVDLFISVAGAGQEIDDVIIDQLKTQAPALVEDARKAFDDIRVNGIATDYGKGLAMIMRPSVQPFLRSWMQYNPQEEIKKIAVPVLLINGDKDLQVQVSEAQKLKEARKDATLIIIPAMNHVLKEINGDSLLENQQAYTNPDLPVSKTLVNEIATFILKE
jgi:hypothetical protein